MEPLLAGLVRLLEKLEPDEIDNLPVKTEVKEPAQKTLAAKIAKVNEEKRIGKGKK